MAKIGKRWSRVKNVLRFEAIKEVVPRKKVGQMKVGQIPPNPYPTPTVRPDTSPKNDNTVQEVLTRPNDSKLSDITNQSGSGFGWINLDRKCKL